MFKRPYCKSRIGAQLKFVQVELPFVAVQDGHHSRMRK